MLNITEITYSSIFIALPNILSNKSLTTYKADENLAYYLAGLIEGDGSFNIPKIIKDSNRKKRVAGIEVSGNSKDFPAFEFLKSKFGGNIY